VSKGLHVRGICNDMPSLFDKDRELIRLANRYRVSYLGLSFVRNTDDIRMTKELIGGGES
jgi:pyruvate kinase